jgi:hypothetical protein
MFTIPTKRTNKPDFPIIEESNATNDGFNARSSGNYKAAKSSRAS